MKTSDPTQLILLKIRPAGYEGGKFIANDRIWRVAVAGDQHKERSGSIRLFTDGRAVIGWFRNHRTGESINLKIPTDGQKISHAEMKRIHREMELKRVREQNDAAAKARRLWLAAEAVRPDHPYIVRKSIKPLSCRQQGTALMIPAIDTSRNIKTVQYIDAAGDKLFLSGGAKRGHFCPLGNPKDSPVAVIVEGWATGCSVTEATGLPVIVAFDASNLAPVAANLQTLYATKDWIICSDNDTFTEGNPGRLGAEKAAMQIRRKGGRGRVVLPGFHGEHPGHPNITRPTDANDYHQLYGLAALRSLILG